MRRSLTLLVLLLMAGCGSRPPVAPPAVESPPPAAAEAPAPERAAAFMPVGDERLTFALNDKPVTEYLLRDGDRFVAVQEGQVYATWFLRDDGLWRLDPKGGGALLRYLPAVLEDGLVWKQQSGDAEVWFSLARGQTGLDTSVTRDQGWILTIVNRTERLELTFAKGIGPAKAESENWKVRTDSYTKRAFKVAPAGPGADQRRAFLAKGLATPPPAPVVTASAGEFAAASRAALLASLPDVKAVDLNGDGQNEYIRGALGAWTGDDVEIFRSDAVLATAIKPWPQSPAQRIRPVTFDGDKRTWFLREQQQGPGKPNWVSILSPLGAELWGWAPKAAFTQGNLVEAAKGGVITVWWDLGDPAGHRWVREYRIDGPANAAWPPLRRLSSHFEPAEAALRMPTEPREVLQAAFIAHWFNLTDELPRYFASAEAAAPLANVKQAMYAPGTVEIGTLTFEDSTGGGPVIKLPKMQPGPVRPDGTATFLAELGSYETSIFTWGTVTFTPDGLIQKLVIEGTSEIM